MKTYRPTEEEMEGPISFWYKEQESNLILPEHDDDEFMTNSTFNPTCAVDGSVNEHVYVSMYEVCLKSSVNGIRKQTKQKIQTN